MKNCKRDKFAGGKIIQEMDYFLEDKMALCLDIRMNQVKYENKHRKMRSRGFF